MKWQSLQTSISTHYHQAQFEIYISLLKQERECQGCSGREICNTEIGRGLAAVTKFFEKYPDSSRPDEFNGQYESQSKRRWGQLRDLHRHVSKHLYEGLDDDSASKMQKTSRGLLQIPGCVWSLEFLEQRIINRHHGLNQSKIRSGKIGVKMSPGRALWEMKFMREGVVAVRREWMPWNQQNKQGLSNHASSQHPFPQIWHSNLFKVFL